MGLKRTIIEKLGGSDMKKLLAALDGHKTTLGLFIAALPDIANQVVALLNSFVPLFVALDMEGPAATITRATGLILAGVGGVVRVWKILSEILKDPKPPNPDLRAGALSGMLLLALLPSLATAQEPAPKPAVEVTLYGGAMQFSERGNPDKRDFVYRLTLSVPAPSGLTLFGRADYTRSQDGGDLLDIKTFRSIEGVIGGRKDIGAGFAVMAFSGATWDRDSNVQPADPRLWTVAGGVRYSVPGRGYVIAAAGHHGPVGGSAFLGSIAYEINDGASWFADVAVPLDASRFAARPYTVKAGVSARLKGWAF